MFDDIYKGKTIVVTGHTGFKGSWLSTWLLSLGATVHGISKDIPTKPSMFEELKLSERMSHHVLDIRNGEQLIQLMTEINPDYVFHLAAQPIVSISYKDPRQTFETNVIGTLNILESIRAIKKKVYAVMITSDKCYENVEWTWGYRENDRLGGKDPYSASKGAAELVIHSYYHSYFKDVADKRIVSVRAGNVIGGGDWAADRIVPDAVRAWAQKSAVTIRRPRATRPWQHVLEPLSGYLRAGQLLSAQQSLSGESYNFGPASEQNVPVIELLNVMSEQWFGNNSQQMINVQEQTSFHEAGLLKLNCDKAFHELSWKPVLDFGSTTRMTTDWYYNYYQKKNPDLFSLTTKQIEDYCALATEKKMSWAR
jgi:CDP-glucose 4,6-dehydratase